MSAGPFFTGEHELTVDEKGRLLVPAEVRKELARIEAGDETRRGKDQPASRDPEAAADGLIILVGQNAKHWIYPEGYYRRHVAPVVTDPVLEPDVLNYLQLVYSTARRATPDRQGRLVLPDDADFNRESLGREVTLVGVSNHLELWRRDEWREHKQQLRSRQAELAERYREVVRRQAGGS